jgi:hypothetical protein
MDAMRAASAVRSQPFFATKHLACTETLPTMEFSKLCQMLLAKPEEWQKRISPKISFSYSKSGTSPCDGYPSQAP